MKKKIIIAVASMILLSGITTGVFSKYQSTVDVAQGSISAKKFEFNAIDKTSDNYKGDIYLAPGEFATLGFEISNGTEESYSEVDMNVKSNWVLTGDLAGYLILSWDNNTTNIKEDIFKLDGGKYSSKEVQVRITLTSHTDNKDVDRYANKDADGNIISWKSANWSMGIWRQSASRLTTRFV